MSNLDDHRKQMDQLNAKIYQLCIERFEILEKISEIKKNKNMPIFNKDRHMEMLKKLHDQFQDIEHRKYIDEIMDELFKKSLDYMKDHNSNG